MLNRRHLRIKILQALYAFQLATDSSLAKAEKELMYSIGKMYDMYLFLLLIMSELRRVEERRIEEGPKKRLPTEADLNPNTRFVENKFLAQLENNFALNRQSEKNKTNWMGEGELIRRLYKSMIETSEYKTYMAGDEPTYKDDQEVIIRIFKRHLINNESLQSFFEERSIFWVDDLDIVASMVIKTFKMFDKKSDETQELLPLWKESDDEQDFVKQLFRKTIIQSDEHMALIKSSTDNWEIDRIALMDMILMKMALSEAREFKQIPVKVTLNEYIEISKYYSTPKSSVFINGILDKLFTQMQDEGSIKKVGRGLVS